MAGACRKSRRRKNKTKQNLQESVRSGNIWPIKQNLGSLYLKINTKIIDHSKFPEASINKSTLVQISKYKNKQIYILIIDYKGTIIP